MSPDHFVEAGNLSLAWAAALRKVSRPRFKELAPLIVSVTHFDNDGDFSEDIGIRRALDITLRNEGSESVDTTANTIFPYSLWNPNSDRQLLYERYARIQPRIRKASRKNRLGTYFGRMIQNGPVSCENQLEFAIQTYCSRKRVRRGVLQVAIFDPSQDHSASALRGFPCLQHVTFAPTEQGLMVNAFYATQYLVKRAYGNYVGLCRLGRFVARELGMPLARVTCFAGIALLDVTRKKLKPVLTATDMAFRKYDEEMSS